MKRGNNSQENKGDRETRLKVEKREKKQKKMIWGRDEMKKKKGKKKETKGM